MKLTILLLAVLLLAGAGCGEVEEKKEIEKAKKTYKIIERDNEYLIESSHFREPSYNISGKIEWLEQRIEALEEADMGAIIEEDKIEPISFPNKEDAKIKVKIGENVYSTMGLQLIGIELEYGEKELQNFIDYRSWFEHYQEKLGLQAYNITFEYSDLSTTISKRSRAYPTGGCGMIKRNYYYKNATVYLNTPENRIKRGCAGVKKIARHEAIHLFLTPMDLMGAEEDITIKLTTETSNL